MQLGNFIPNPIGQAIGKAGNFLGAGIDAYQAYDNFQNEDYIGTGINAASLAIPFGLSKKGAYVRDMYNTQPGSLADDIARLGSRDGTYRPLTPLLNQGSIPAIRKGINTNRSIFGALGGETYLDIKEFGGNIIAQNGREMQYYQEGLDWKPKTISRDGSSLPEAQKGYIVPNWATDLSTRLSNAVSTLGTSAIGDVVKGVSPRAADWLNENTMGFIPYTTDEQLMATRAGNPNRGLNATGQISDAVSDALLNKMIGPLAGKANKVIKKGTSKVVKGASNFAQDFSKGYKAVPTREDGGIIEDPNGQWAYPGEITRIPSNQITMQGVPYPVMGVSNTGDTQMMYPNQDYTYDGESVTEYPMMQDGGPVEKTYGTYNLPEVVVTPEPEEKGFWEQSIKSFLDENKDAGLLGALSSVVTYPLGLPQQAMMYGLTGKVQKPSTAMGITNPIGSFVTDAIADPTNFVGAGLADDAFKLSNRAGELSPYINKTLKSTRQYLPEKGQFINEIKDLKRAIAPPQPTFINPAEQELLSTVRNVGIMSKTGVNDAAVLEKILNKSVQLGEKEFENLVGSTRSQIQEKIQALRASGSTKKPDVNNEVIDLSRRPSSQTTIAEDLGIDQDPGWLRLQERLRNRNQSASNPPYDEVGNIVSEPSTSDIARAIQSQEQIDLSIINQLPDPPIYFSLEDLGSNFSTSVNKSLIKGLTERVNKNKYLPLVADESDSLLPVLYRDQSNNPTADILKAYRTLENAPSGSTFKGSSSLSTDSYPATLKMTQKALKSDIADVNYIGMRNLNTSGFSQEAKVSKDLNIKEINTMIDQLNKKLPKPIPYAYKKGYDIVAPHITVTRKKNGGWLSKYN
jgi:hypothetical protein